VAVAPAVSYVSSFMYSIFVMDKLQDYHQYDKYNLFLYSCTFFILAGIPLYTMKVDEFWTPVLLYSSLVLQGMGLANMMNTSTSLVSEMIGQDDQASAVVFASFNIIESFAVGGVGFVIISLGMTDCASSLKFILGLMPIICAVSAYGISWGRWHNATKQFYGD
jgi:MFS family permease